MWHSFLQQDFTHCAVAPTLFYLARNSTTLPRWSRRSIGIDSIGLSALSTAARRFNFAHLPMQASRDLHRLSVYHLGRLDVARTSSGLIAHTAPANGLSDRANSTC